MNSLVIVAAAVALNATPVGVLEPCIQEGLRIEPLRATPRSALGDNAEVSGTLLDMETGQPIIGASVTLGEGAATISDDAGAFRMGRLKGGSYILTIRHAAYGAPTGRVTIAPGQEFEFMVRAAMRPIPLDSIDVSAEQRPGAAEVPFANRNNVVSGAALEAARTRGETVAQVAARLPTLRVRHGRFATTSEVSTGVCLESRRGTPRLRPQDVSVNPRLPFCDPIAVIVDGVDVGDPISFLRGLRLEDFESIEFLPPALAGPRYGLLAGNGGVLLLVTRRR